MGDRDNVLRPQFGRTPAVEKSTGVEPPEDELSALLSRVLNEAGHESIYLEYVRPMRAYLATLQGHVSQKTIQDHMNVLGAWTDAELIAAAKTSTTFDWKARPAHYTALIRVIRSREHIV